MRYSIELDEEYVEQLYNIVGLEDHEYELDDEEAVEEAIKLLIENS